MKDRKLKLLYNEGTFTGCLNLGHTRGQSGQFQPCKKVSQRHNARVSSILPGAILCHANVYGSTCHIVVGGKRSAGYVNILLEIFFFLCWKRLMLCFLTAHTTPEPIKQSVW